MTMLDELVAGGLILLGGKYLWDNHPQYRPLLAQVALESALGQMHPRVAAVLVDVLRARRRNQLW